MTYSSGIGKPKVKKTKPVKETLEELQAASREEVNKTDGKRQDIATKINGEYMGAGFFFSVVFDSQSSRDAWCKSHGLTLRDDEYILSSDFDITITRR